MATFKQEKVNAKMDEVDLVQEVGEDHIMRFDSHEDVKGALGLTQIFVKGEAKESRKGSGLEDGGRRDATKEGSGNRRFADPNSGPRVAGPDGMGANGLRQVSKREVSVPKVKRPAVLSRVASEVRTPKGAGKAGQ